jgi:hypothetical protein
MTGMTPVVVQQHVVIWALGRTLPTGSMLTKLLHAIAVDAGLQPAPAASSPPCLWHPRSDARLRRCSPCKVGAQHTSMTCQRQATSVL